MGLGSCMSSSASVGKAGARGSAPRRRAAVPPERRTAPWLGFGFGFGFG